MAVAGAALLAGCAATGVPYTTPAPQPGATDALVYIYRPDGDGLKLRDAYFYLDDVNIVDLSHKGYTWFHVPAGDYTIKQKWPADVTLGMKTLEIPVRWQAGGTYFYRLHTRVDVVSLRWRLGQVPPEEAVRELPACRLQPATGLPKFLEQRARR